MSQIALLVITADSTHSMAMYLSEHGKTLNEC